MSQGPSGWATIGRLFSLLVGPGLMFVFAAAIWQSGDNRFHGKSIAYFVILLGVVMGRVVEFRGGDPRTSTGQPAAPSDLGKFILQAVGLALAVWGVAIAFGRRI